MSIQCAKCKSVNSPEAEKCQKCGADLLPGFGSARTVGVILGFFFMALMGFAAFMSGGDSYKCLIPMGIGVLAFTLWGVSRLGHPSMQYRRYENRARRHTKTDPDQAYADFTKAIRLAPWSLTAYQGRCSLHDKVDLSIDDLCEEIEFLANTLNTSSRRSVLKKDLREILARQIVELSIKRINREGELGLANEVLSHQVQLLDFMEANVEDIHQFKTDTIGFGAGITMHLRGELRKNIQKTQTELYRRGLVKAIGYCRRCKEEVEPDLDLDCSKNKSHGKIDKVRFFIPDMPSKTPTDQE